MSRYCGEDRDVKPCLDAADHWRQQALLSNGSAFSDASLWQLAHLEALDQYFVNQLDKGDDVKDTDEVVDVYIERLLELQIDAGLAVYVVPLRPLKRISL